MARTQLASVGILSSVLVHAAATFAGSPPNGALIPSRGTPFGAPMSENASIEALVARELGGPPGLEAIYGDGTRFGVGSLLSFTDFGQEYFLDLGATVLELDAVSTVGDVTTFVVRAANTLQLVTVESSPGGDWILNQQPLTIGAFGDGKRDGVVVCDVTGDGIDDIVTFSQGAGELLVYPGLSGGSFSGSPITSTLATDSLASITLADFDGDGDKDFAGFTSPGGFYPLENLGNGAFASFTNPAPPTMYGADAATGVAHDFTGDGNVDLAVGNAFSALELWLGNGSGGFAASPVLIPSPTGASLYVLADFNGDGMLDVGSALFFNLVAIYYGTGSSLSPPIVLRVGNAAAGLVPCDADQDGDTDLVVTHASFGVPCGPVLIENTGPAGGKALESIGALPINSGASIAVGDFDGNGYNDVLLSTLSFTNHLSLNSGNAALAPLIDLDYPESFPGLAPVTPADGDPRALIAYRLTSPAQAGWLRYNVDFSTFDFGGFASLPGVPLDIRAEDINVDGREDFVVSYAGGNPAASVFPQNASGSFDAPIPINIVDGGKILRTDDVDGDDDPDLSFFDDAQLVFAQRLSGWQFTTGTTRVVLELPDMRAAAIANVDGVGTADAVMVGKGPGATDFRLVVMPNFLTSDATTTIDLPALPTGVVAYDFDEDGDDDLAITLDRVGAADAIATLENEGGYSADRIALSLSGSLPISMILADLHETIPHRGGPTARPAPEAVVLNVGPSFPGVAGVTFSPNLRDTREQTQAPCPGDANGDNQVNFTDLNAVLSAFGQSGAPGFSGADLNNDGIVNFVDLNTVLSAFGSSCA
jgi:hypothetical protein